MVDTSQSSGRDSWLVDNSITVTLPTGLSSKEIAAKLLGIRNRMEDLKKEYKRASRNSPREAALFHEIIRAAKAIEAMKDRLIVDGVRFEIDERDIEHPEAARKRLGWWSW